MAQLYERRELRDESLKLADPLLEQAADLEPDSYEELRELIQRLRPAA